MRDWIGIAVTLVLGLLGLYLVNSVRQRVRSTVADRRFLAYAALWSDLRSASPLRHLSDLGPLSPDDRQKLFTRLTNWYYDDGNGMLLARDTRGIYLRSRENLVCPATDLRPASLAETVMTSSDPELVRSAASIRQLSLLRTAMRWDLRAYGRDYGEPVTEVDREFLRTCGLNADRAPWRRAAWRRLLPR
jgi:hypothetical protein